METTASHESYVAEERRRAKKKRKINRIIFICSFLIIPVIQWFIYWLYLNASSIPLAFIKRNEYLGTEQWVGWQNFQKVFDMLKNDMGEPGLLTKAIINSLTYFVLNIFILQPMTVILAYFFWKKMPGHKLFRISFLLPSLLPAMVLPMLYSFMLDSSVGVLTPLMRWLGLGHLVPENGWLGSWGTAQFMILFYQLWVGCGTSIILISGNINRLPVELFECARLEGITMFQELVHLVLPMIMPLFSIMFISGINGVLNIYMPAMLITKGGPNSSTKTIAYFILDWTTGGEEGVAAAAGWLFSCITIPLVFGVKSLFAKITPEVDY